VQGASVEAREGTTTTGKRSSCATCVCHTCGTARRGRGKWAWPVCMGNGGGLLCRHDGVGWGDGGFAKGETVLLLLLLCCLCVGASVEAREGTSTTGRCRSSAA
jgi:hypothetical protein